MRITDMCPLLDDTIAIAAIYRCICRMLYRLRLDNQRWWIYSRFLVDENRWRAQRYGVEEGLVDFGAGEVVPFAELLDELIALIREDAEFFGCEAEVAHAREIVRRGTSAQRQLAAHRGALAAGADARQALEAVVDLLVGETVTGL